MRWTHPSATLWRHTPSGGAPAPAHEEPANEFDGGRDAWLSLLAAADDAEVAHRIEVIRQQLGQNAYDIDARLDDAIDTLLDDLTLSS